MFISLFLSLILLPGAQASVLLVVGLTHPHPRRGSFPPLRCKDAVAVFAHLRGVYFLMRRSV